MSTQPLETTSIYVGSPLKRHEIALDARWIMNFAASIFDANPLYFDDLAEGGVIAHPMIATALTWGIAKDIGDNVLAEGFPGYLNKMQVHYTETLIWHRPMRAGERVIIDGQVAAILPHRAGTLMVIRFDAATSAGEPIFTEYAGAVLREVKCLDGGTGAEAVPPLHRYKSDAIVWERKIPVHPLACHIYDGCANIHFPIHTSRKFAQSVGLPDTILHGTATLSYAVTELTNREADGDPRRVKQLDCRFVGMVYPGTSISVALKGRVRDEEVTNLFFDVLDEDGRRVITNGRLSIADHV